MNSISECVYTFPVIPISHSKRKESADCLFVIQIKNSFSHSHRYDFGCYKTQIGLFERYMYMIHILSHRRGRQEEDENDENRKVKERKNKKKTESDPLFSRCQTTGKITLLERNNSNRNGVQS